MFMLETSAATVLRNGEIEAIKPARPWIPNVKFFAMNIMSNETFTGFDHWKNSGFK